MSKASGLVRPRLRHILKHHNFRMSLLLGVVIFVAMTWVRVPSRHAPVKVSELSGSILTFTSMGFAVSTTAVALILAMPHGRVTALMVVNSRNSPPVQVVEKDGDFKAQRPEGSITGTLKLDPKTTGYLELISVFLITALANVTSSAAVIAWAVIAGGDDVLRSHSIENNLLAGVVIMLVAYSGLQMITSIKTLYQVAEIIQGVMRERLY